MNKFENIAFKAVGISGIISNAIILFYSPFYETHVNIYVVPFLSLCMILLFVFYLRKAFWAYQLSFTYAVSAIIIHGLFLGHSNDEYGQFVQIMYAREVFQIGLGIAMLFVNFLPGVRAFYKNKQAKR